MSLSDGDGQDKREVWGDRFYRGVLHSRYFELAEADCELQACLSPFVERFTEFRCAPGLLFLICQASEDKPFVERLCSLLDANEIPVGYDKREIKVGDSIVQRVSDGLRTASHLVLVLSRLIGAQAVGEEGIRGRPYETTARVRQSSLFRFSSTTAKFPPSWLKGVDL